MIFYLTLYAVVVVLCLLSRLADNIDKKFIVATIFLLLVSVAGVRDNTGTDFPAYKAFYESANPVGYEFEYTYLIIHRILHFFYLPTFSFFLACSAITCCFFFKGFKEHSNDAYLSIILFIALGFYTNSFNIVRQFVALSIYFCYSLRYIKQKRLVYYVLSTLGAALFHISAILLLPFYFILNLNISGRYMIIVLALAILFNLGFLNISYITPLISVLPAKYAGYFQFLEHYLDTLSEPLWLKFLNNIDKLAILFFLVRFKKKLIADRPSNNVLINFYFISIVFFFVSRGLAELQRIGLYFSMFALIAIPLVISIPRKGYIKAAIYCLIVLMYSFYFALFVLNKNVGEVIPYKSIF